MSTFDDAVAAYQTLGDKLAALKPADPPVVTPPPVAERRIQTSYAHTNYFCPDWLLQKRWVKGGGDYIDKNGILNGPTPWVSYKVTADPVQVVDISSIDGDIIVHGMQGYWDHPTIDGPAAQASWVDSSTYSTLAFPGRWGDPCFIFNPTRGKTLTFTATANDAGSVIRLDKVAAPVIAPIPYAVSQYTQPDVLYIPCTSRADIKKFIGVGRYQPGSTPDSLAYNERYGVEPTTGMPFVEFTNQPAPDNNQRLISWFFDLAKGYNDLWWVHWVWIGTDVRDAMTEKGMKLCGLGCSDATALIHEHGPVSDANPGVYSLRTYRYDATGDQQQDESYQITPDGYWLCLEGHLKLDSAVGAGDGLEEIYANGTLLVSRRNKVSRGGALITEFHGQVYHGGMGMPRPGKLMHYRLAEMGVATQRIGVNPKYASLLVAPTA